MQQAKLAVSMAAILVAGCVNLPDLPTTDQVQWLNQGWTDAQRAQFHHRSQGTMLPIPYEWFAALEQPGLHPNALLIEKGYLSRLGFIASGISPDNQAGLPVGFAVDYGVTNPAISDKPFNAVGLTCAACHTGQMTVKDPKTGGSISLRYDGGPAMTNLTELTTVLGVSMMETYIDPIKFARFAQRVLGDTNTDSNRAKLRDQYRKTLKLIMRATAEPKEIQRAGLSDHDMDPSTNMQSDAFEARVKSLSDDIKSRNQAVEEGFTRLDALNRIGNTVFGVDAQKPHNIATIDAPVNYPHIWNTSWFMWVQYDGSIMGPMIRNAGEAMGVSAFVHMQPNDPKNFDSSVRVDNLYWMEELLAGETPPHQQKRFGGLQAPLWPENILGKIDDDKHAAGAKLYAELCQGCHLPPVDSDAFWEHKAWTPPDQYNRRYLNLKQIAISEVGTDPKQAEVLLNRKVDTTGLGINSKLYLDQGKGCEEIHVKDGPAESFALSLGAAVQQTTQRWYQQHKISAEKQLEMDGFRKNCLRAEPAYKARPLNGIWATAPYLHNGSVPNIDALLSPVDQRPSSFYLGNLTYQTEVLGYDHTTAKRGLFKLDTRIPGNFNTGHEFADTKTAGVIGRALSKQEREQLIEFLKHPGDLKKLRQTPQG